MKPLTLPLIGDDGDKGIDSVVELMNEYGLMREDWDSVCDLVVFHSNSDPRRMIDSKIKSSFTRTFNKQSHGVRAVATKKVSAKSVSVPGGDEVEEEEENIITSEDEDQDDVKSDKLIKAKKKPVKRKASTSTNSKKKAKK